MANNQGLTVGLAVGIPSFIIISVVFIFWYRNHRKQLREDLVEDDIDIGLRDDRSFLQFHQELNKPVNGPDFNGAHDSNGSSTLTEHVVTAPNAKINHGQKNSIYDFYETFIPVLPDDTVNSTKADDSQHDSGVESSQASVLMNNLSPAINMQNDKSLDSLAKHLSTPQFFEKLPSNTNPVSLRHRASNLISNNSSTDILNNLVGEGVALNDNFVYVSNTVGGTDNLLQAHPHQENTLAVPLHNAAVMPPASPKPTKSTSSPLNPKHLETSSLQSAASSPFEDRNQINKSIDYSQQNDYTQQNDYNQHN